VVRESGQMTSYLDGTLRSTSDPSITFTPGSGYGHLNIGAARTVETASLYGGLLDDVRVYNRALDQTDVERLYAQQSIAFSPMARWRLDESGSGVKIVADPVRSALMVWPSGTLDHWMPATNAYVRSVQRQ